MKALLKRFWTEEEGLELVEYAVMTALIVAAVVITITELGGAIEGQFGDVEKTIDKIGKCCD